MRNNNIDFRFHSDSFELLKAKDSEGNEIMRIGGIAATEDVDQQDEILVVSGMDISDLEGGLCNWQHQSNKDPSSIIGTISKAEKRKEGLYLECDLFSEHKMSKDVYNLTKMLNKSNTNKKMSFSIEGRAIQRDTFNPKKVIKSCIKAVAITPTPVNRNTFAQIIKGETNGLEEPIYTDVEKVEKASANGGEVTYILDHTDDNGVRYTIDENYNLKIDKSLTVAGNAAPLVKESLDSDLKDISEKPKKIKKSFLFNDKNTIFTDKLEKSQIFDYFFKAIPDLTIENAKGLYNVIVEHNKLHGLEMTNENISKAFEVLTKLSEIDLEKGEMSPKESDLSSGKDGSMKTTPISVMTSMVEKGCSKDEVMKGMKEKYSDMKEEDMEKMYESNFGNKKSEDDKKEKVEKSEDLTIEEKIEKAQAELEALQAEKEKANEVVEKSETLDESKVEDLIKGFSEKFESQFNKFDEIIKSYAAKTEDLQKANDELNKSIEAKDEDFNARLKEKEEALNKAQSEYNALANSANTPKTITATDYIKKSEEIGNSANEMSITQQRDEILNKAEQFIDWAALESGDSIEKSYAEDAINDLKYNGQVNQTLFNRFEKRGIKLVQ